MTRKEIVEHMKVMGQNAAKMDEVMMYVMTRKDCEVVMAAAELMEAQEPVEPVKANRSVGYWCRCGWYLGISGSVKYCANCGRKVKWE